MNKYVESSLFRYTGKTDWWSGVKLYLRDSSFRWIVAFRFINSSGFEKTIGVFLWYLRNKDICIPKETDIGYRLYLGHGNIVVNRTAKIGNNVNLSNFTTIGSNYNNAATIGDNVYIGPNCCIVENVHVGNNVTIGAGSIVTKSIPDNATVAGNYAKILNFDSPARFINNKWNL